MAIPMFLVDAFASAPLSGNPAAVCLLQAAVETTWMQSMAGEMNQAETAFVLRQGEDWSLRWFTPTMEVDLCGHATLAAAHVLWSEGIVTRTQPVRFHTRSGVLIAAADEQRIVLDFPAIAMVPCSPPEGLIGALGVLPMSVFRAGPDLVVEVMDAQTVIEAKPDMPQLAAMSGRGVAITAAGEVDCDVISRFFAPAAGIPEDAVTGSLHCALGPFWSKRLRRSVLRCRQASARGGMLEVEARGERVFLTGTAVTVLAGHLR